MSSRLLVLTPIYRLRDVLVPLHRGEEAPRRIGDVRLAARHGIALECAAPKVLRALRSRRRNSTFEVRVLCVRQRSQVRALTLLDADSLGLSMVMSTYHNEPKMLSGLVRSILYQFVGHN